MNLYIFALLFIAAQAKNQFEVTDKSNVTCVMLNINGTITLEAEEKTKVNETTNFDKAVLLSDSNCTLLKLNLDNKTDVWFRLSADKKIIPVVSFNTSLVFNVGKDIVTVEGNPLIVGSNHSYLCNAQVDHKFNSSKEANYTYTVSALLHNLQIQFGEFQNDTFGPSDSCDEDKTTSAPNITTPSTTVTPTPTTSPTTTTTAPPSEDVFVCQDGNITRLRFEANISLSITYETSKENVTVQISVPLHTANDSTCTNLTEEVLNIRFLGDFNLTYVFQRSSNSSDSYYVSKISLSYNTEYFKDAKINETLTAEYIPQDSTYLSASKKEYYRCNANSTVDLGKNVRLSTVELKYRAFNTDGDISFSGDATECSADEETSSVVPIAVGAALAGLVVIVLIAYLIGRRRSRKAGYESV